MNGLLSLLSNLALTGWVATPVLLGLLSAFSAWTRSPLKRRHCWRLGHWVLVLVLASSLVLGLLLLINIAGWNNGLTSHALGFGLYPDGLAVWMALLVSAIALAILHYANDYLRGDTAYDRFLPWFLVTVACVLLLVFTANLLVIALAWIGSSLALHNLLTLYSERPAARQAALQKFIASRVGDLCVMIAILLIHHVYGTFRLPLIQSQLTAADTGGVPLQVASVLLAIAALLKCAQIPFHGWLIRVMEAPTPVSALLHAGLINLGGFLWLRLYPALDGFTIGHALLIVVGGLSAILAVLVMQTQSSIKHTLAWSTCAQMGFMLFEIGLGAYHLALLHLLAHSLYKANAFLSAGRTVTASRQWYPPGIPTTVTRVPAALMLALGVGLLSAAWDAMVNNPVLALLMVLALTGTVLGTPGASRRGQYRMLVWALLVWLVAIGLGALFSTAVPAPEGFERPLAVQVVALVLVGLLLVSTLMIRFLPGLERVRIMRTHCANGFYLDQPFDRACASLAHSGRFTGLLIGRSLNSRNAVGDKS